MKHIRSILYFGLFIAGGVSAQEAESTPIYSIDPFEVIGSKEQALGIPGSATFIDLGEISSFNYDNIDQVIRRVPGVYFRTEDGFGLFPNISLRGVGTMRSSNVTIMEDGILSAPAPYAAPAAYYSPTIGRMSAIEIIKGSSQVRYGPQITGGVINYRSTRIPETKESYAKAVYGSENDFRTHVWDGNRIETENGTFGYLAEIYYRRADGFKTIDGTGASSSSDQTGFVNFEPMVKVYWEPRTETFQRVEVKFGYTDRDADETYLGLTTEDFRVDPFRRYASTRFDNIDTEHYRTYVRYRIEPDVDTRLSATAYYNDFERAWYKTHDVNGGGGNTSLSEALASPESSELAVLRGEGAGSFRVRNNARSYKSYGVQTFLERRFETGEVGHDVELGLRLHEDYEDRFQNQDVYNQAGNGAITSIERGAPGSQDNRRGTATALALSLSDTVTYDQWTLTPGLRYENVWYENEDRRPGRTSGEDQLNVFGYGIGVLYDLSTNHSVFANAFRGFALPSPSAVVNDGIGEETSNAFEVGYRYNNADEALRAEAILFLTQFDDLIVPDNIGGAGTGDGTENVGEAQTQGIELSLSYDHGFASDWAVRTPAYVAFTYTDAELRNDVNAGGGGGGAVESIFAGGRKGAELPYIPEFQISFGAGIEWGRIGLFADAFFVESTFGTASNVSDERRPDGTPDARFGKNDAYFLLDLSGRYAVNENTSFLVGVNNALDEEYLASRLPHGPRPGQGRFWYGGLELSF